jgi:hypothetical protein
LTPLFKGLQEILRHGCQSEESQTVRHAHWNNQVAAVCETLLKGRMASTLQHQLMDVASTPVHAGF